jgi:nucleoredoxin
MPWLAVPWEQEERRRELAALLGVQGIPTLVLLDADGSVITADGRGEVNEDPLGEVSQMHSINGLSEVLIAGWQVS